MIAASALLSSAMMTALLSSLGAGSKALLYSGTRPATPGGAPGGSAVGQVLFADIAGTIEAGALVLAPGPVAVAVRRLRGSVEVGSARTGPGAWRRSQSRRRSASRSSS